LFLGHSDLFDYLIRDKYRKRRPQQINEREKRHYENVRQAADNYSESSENKSQEISIDVVLLIQRLEDKSQIDSYRQIFFQAPYNSQSFAINRLKPAPVPMLEK
jgi:hypothetical protein